MATPAHAGLEHRSAKQRGSIGAAERAEAAHQRRPRPRRARTTAAARSGAAGSGSCRLDASCPYKGGRAKRAIERGRRAETAPYIPCTMRPSSRMAARLPASCTTISTACIVVARGEALTYVLRWVVLCAKGDLMCLAFFPPLTSVFCGSVVGSVSFEIFIF